MRHTFFDLVRENTGRHFLDSGGDNGRNWQQPAVSGDDPEIYYDGYTWTISTPHLLSNCLEIVQDMTDTFHEKYADSDDSWFNDGQDYMQELGYTLQSRGNVYNGENDLSQVYIWEVWTIEESTDWIYAGDDTITVIYTHNGCDVRGGYSSPVFCTPKGDYSIPVDICVEFREINRKGYYIDSRISEEGSCGYSGNPWYHLESNFFDRIFWFTLDREKDSFVVKGNDGEFHKIQAAMPYNGC